MAVGLGNWARSVRPWDSNFSFNFSGFGGLSGSYESIIPLRRVWSSARYVLYNITRVKNACTKGRGMAREPQEQDRPSEVAVDRPVTSATTVANEMLKIAKRQGKHLTPMQLMKLVYIAHGWSLALLRRDLFSDRIEAWKYGPVLPSLYHATKSFGRNPIPHDLIDDDMDTPLEPNVQAFLEDVFSKYGDISGVGLSNLTHRPGSPWDQVYRDGVMNIEIPDSLIREHYTEKLNDRQGSTTA